jgi:hypothetical protein
MPRNPVEREPVITTAIAALLTFLAGRYGLELSAEHAAAAAGMVLTFLAPFARQLVRPTGSSVEPTVLESAQPPAPPTPPTPPEASTCRALPAP